MKIICVGDSITYGLGSSNNSEINYPKILSKLLNCQVDNYGVSGSTICAEGAEDNKEKSMVNRVKQINFSSYTHCLIMGGTNDYTLNFSLNSIYNSVLEILQTILLSNKNIKIIFMTPFYRNNWYKGDSDSIPNDKGIFLYQIVNEIIRCCLKYDIKVLNMYLISGFNKANYKAYFVDGLHPNDDGYYKLTDVIYNKFKVVM